MRSKIRKIAKKQKNCIKALDYQCHLCYNVYDKIVLITILDNKNERIENIMLNKTELVKLFQGHGFSKNDSVFIVEEFIKAIETALVNNDEVHLKEFGTFKTVDRKARVSQINGKSYDIPAHKSVKFTASKKLNEKLPAPAKKKKAAKASKSAKTQTKTKSAKGKKA